MANGGTPRAAGWGGHKIPRSDSPLAWELPADPSGVLSRDGL